MQSLVATPNNNYRIDQSESYNFKHRLVATITEFVKDVGQFLSMGEAIAISMTCREAFKLAHKPLRKVVLRSGHLSQELRPKLWLH
jgi:hypothetical protein